MTHPFHSSAATAVRRIASMLFVCSALAAPLAAMAASEAPVTETSIADTPLVESPVTVGGTQLSMNGSGIRYKGPFQVYRASLYTAERVRTLEGLVNSKGAKVMTLHMLRQVNATQMGSLFTRGLKDNMPEASYVRVSMSMLQMGDMFNKFKTLESGDEIRMEWVPKKGMIISVNGEQQGAPMPDPVMFQAMMSIWLGHDPADWKLRDALLGFKPAAPQVTLH